MLETLGYGQSLDEKDLNWFSGTKAFMRYKTSSDRVEKLLYVSITGLNKYIEQHDELLEKFQRAEVDPDELLGEDEESMFKPNGKGGYALRVNQKELDILSEAMEFSKKEHKILDKYIYSILVVFVWGSFETYLNQAFSEIYRIQPQILKNEISIYSSMDILNNLDDPLELLINKELNKVGHFKLNDWEKYLKKNINFNFDENVSEKLSGIYLIRNIVAHNTGVVRVDQRDQVPKELEVIEDEIVVSDTYLIDSIRMINNAVSEIEIVLRNKFFKDK
ncbi:hypothetical protein COL52_26680 [Bacillus toyonensis]|uniref:RiboL-PSP-HEPN domain-containing protein n=1 Tax=Bacillus toyonensis TaxID=155322 RepID=A0A2B7VPW8_9BACI|nr:hypothetical protein [Bacillus toyonensis]PFY54898.1 hypothetical protein COL52_26680 [Bacillus toyonensis]PGG86360.1 hypothetical protein CON73_23680 [Bacillus toyonensis]